MIVYLAGYKTVEKLYPDCKDVFLLSSFWEHKSGSYGEYVTQDKHILDSGAFSAINDKTGRYKNFNWDDYVRKYIQFIKNTDQKLFFELDIDCVVGLSKVEYYRKMIEDATGIAPIPVWHSNRGIDYFDFMCENYKYVAIGTTTASIEGQRIRKNPSILSTFIHKAHKNGAKIHGLGFTSIPWLHKLKFDSVDSTTWVNGGKYGEMFLFRYNTLIKVRKKNQRVADYQRANVHNFKQWVKFQQYANYNL